MCVIKIKKMYEIFSVYIKVLVFKIVQERATRKFQMITVLPSFVILHFKYF